MKDLMKNIHMRGDELVQELQKVQGITGQGVALDFLQQLINGILSTYTLARFTIKGYVLQDCYTSSGEKKIVQNIAEVLKEPVKAEVSGEEVRNSLKEDDGNTTEIKNNDEVGLSIKEELVLASASYVDTKKDGEKNEESTEGEIMSDKEYILSDEENNVDDDSDERPLRNKKQVKGARKRKQGFKVRIARTHKKSVPCDDASEELNDEKITRVKRSKRKKSQFGKKAENQKKKKETDDVIKYASNLFCFICEDEDLRYSTEEDYFEHCLKEHVDHSHDNKVSLPCNKCDKSFRVSNIKGAKSYLRTPIYTLLNHLVTKHGIMRPDWAPVYKCKNCQHTTLVRNFLPHHEKTCGQVVPIVTCEFCGMMLKKNSLYLHTKRCSNPASKIARFKCDDCGKMYLTQAILDIHVKRMHKKEASHLCTQCTETFFAKVDLERHMFVHHGVNISRMKVVSCPVCNFQTLEGSLMRKHMKNHEIGSHPCEYCGRIFGTMNRLRMHRLTHTAERKHQCPHCTYTAIRSFHLQRHIAVRHLGSPFKCNRCTFSTTSTKNLQRHMRKSHKCDELTAIEETNNIAASNTQMPPNPSRTRKRRIVEVSSNPVKLPADLAKEQPNNAISEVPIISQQMVVESRSNTNASQQQIAQQTTNLPQEQQQQPITVAPIQPSEPAYLQPVFHTPYGVPYSMQVPGVPTTVPSTANAEHASFLRHVFGQKMSAVPNNLQQNQQDPNSLYSVHYSEQQHQTTTAIMPEQPEQRHHQQQYTTQ